MLSHVTVGSDDLEAAQRFYDAVLGTLGWRLKGTEVEEGWLCYCPAEDDWPEFLVCRPFDGGAASFGNGVTIGFRAKSRAQVDAFHAAGLAAGGRDEGAPGLRPQYTPDFYGAYLRDPQGNKLCCCYEGPAGD